MSVRTYWGVDLLCPVWLVWKLIKVKSTKHFFYNWNWFLSKNLLPVYPCPQKSTTVAFFMSSGMIFWDIILGLAYVLQYFGMKIYYENIFASVEKEIKLLIGPKKKFSVCQSKKKIRFFSKLCIVISSRNNVPKYYFGWHEKDLRLWYGGEQEFIRKDWRKELLYYGNLIRAC